MVSGRSLVWLLLAVMAFGAGDTRSAPQAARRAEELADRLPLPLALEFRVAAAQTLQPRYPELARKIVDGVLGQVRSGKAAKIGSPVIRPLVELAPEETIAAVQEGAPGALPAVIGALAQYNQPDRALAVYRLARAAGTVGAEPARPLMAALARQKRPEAGALLQETISTVSFDPLDPLDAWSLMMTAAPVAPVAHDTVVDLYERILKVASAPGYADQSKGVMTATFRSGSKTVTTTNARDTVLLAAASWLQAIAPDRLEKFRAQLSRWDLSVPMTLQNFNIRAPHGTARGGADPAAAEAINKNLTQFRGLPTDADRARLAIETAAKIRALPTGPEKLGLAQSLCNLATEGDLGKDALQAAAGALAQAIRETSAGKDAWLELATLVRYEHVKAPFSDPALDEADSLLALRETLVQEAGLTLTGLDGKTYSLADLRGRVVLVNFWATWCPPCRKEMPDMEKLYREFEKKGLTVLAVSDEERDTVTGYLQKQNYTFPVLLDPGRKVNTAFSVEGIPKSFLFDREGKLVAQAMDMRTERQFREMLKTAGLE